MKRVITGLGIASALGVHDAAGLFDAMKAPERTTARPPAEVTSFDASGYGEPPRIVEVPAFDPSKWLGDKGLRTLDRLTKLLVVAARICLHDAGFKKDGAWVSGGPETVGLCCSNAYGSLESISELDRVAKLEDARYINPAKFPNTVSNSAAGYVSIWEDLRALNVSISDGNCGALDAVSCADIFLASERARALLVGGGEAMSEPLFLAFSKLQALGPSRLGEGAAFFAVEPAEAATARSAKVLGTLAGYGTAYVSRGAEVLIQASKEAMKRAIDQALTEAGVREVDVVASSLSGLSRFDKVELAAIDETLGASVTVSAPKQILGETLGAGGALAIAAGLAWLSGVAPSALVRGQARPVKTVLVTALGYYGNASAVVLRA